ncbi:ATPase family AAA domain-containing protein 5 [Smittium mucronatum]|uniref:ATPase family AAA domain-containing protein 5 n=1 Tax=Smittium mucronatum TaxID=133383 RepID=A0A1R0GVF0_9FUNG|nr:ATPase family AAA domain-containing protein 5 [Smittium mucronatum]
MVTENEVMSTVDSSSKKRKKGEPKVQGNFQRRLEFKPIAMKQPIVLNNSTNKIIEEEIVEEVIMSDVILSGCISPKSFTPISKVTPKSKNRSKVKKTDEEKSGSKRPKVNKNLKENTPKATPTKQISQNSLIDLSVKADPSHKYKSPDIKSNVYELLSSTRNIDINTIPIKKNPSKDDSSVSTNFTETVSLQSDIDESQKSSSDYPKDKIEDSNKDTDTFFQKSPEISKNDSNPTGEIILLDSSPNSSFDLSIIGKTINSKNNKTLDSALKDKIVTFGDKFKTPVKSSKKKPPSSKKTLKNQSVLKKKIDTSISKINDKPLEKKTSLLSPNNSKLKSVSKSDSKTPRNISSGAHEPISRGRLRMLSPISYKMSSRSIKDDSCITLNVGASHLKPDIIKKIKLRYSLPANVNIPETERFIQNKELEEKGISKAIERVSPMKSVDRISSDVSSNVSDLIDDNSISTAKLSNFNDLFKKSANQTSKTPKESQSKNRKTKIIQKNNTVTRKLRSSSSAPDSNLDTIVKESTEFNTASNKSKSSKDFKEIEKLSLEAESSTEINHNLEAGSENKTNDEKETHFFFLHSDKKKELEKKISLEHPYSETPFNQKGILSRKDTDKRKKIIDDTVVIDDYDFNKAKDFSKVKIKSVIQVPWPGQVFGSDEHVHYYSHLEQTKIFPKFHKSNTQPFRTPEKINFESLPRISKELHPSKNNDFIFQDTYSDIQAHNLFRNNYSLQDRSLLTPSVSPIPADKVDQWNVMLSQIPIERGYNKRILSSIIETASGIQKSSLGKPNEDRNTLIADKYAPKCVDDIVGNTKAVLKLAQWLKNCSINSSTSKDLSKKSDPKAKEESISQCIVKKVDEQDNCTPVVSRKRLVSVYSSNVYNVDPKKNTAQRSDSPPAISDDQPKSSKIEELSKIKNNTTGSSKKTKSGGGSFFSKKTEPHLNVKDGNPPDGISVESITVIEIDQTPLRIKEGDSKKKRRGDNKKTPQSRKRSNVSKGKRLDSDEFSLDMNEFTTEEMDFFQNYEFSTSEKSSLFGRKHLFGKLDDNSNSLSSDRIKKPFSIMDRVFEPIQNPDKTRIKPVIRSSSVQDSKKNQSTFESYGNDVGIALLVGPSGSGKTASVYALAKNYNYYVHEINAGELRSGKVLMTQLQELVKSHVVIGGSGNKFIQKQNVAKTFFKMKGMGKILPKKDSALKGLVIDDGGRDENSEDVTSPSSGSENNDGFAYSDSKQVLILIENVDVLFEQDSGMLVALDMIASKSKRPIIATCSNLNDNSTSIQLSDLSFRLILEFEYPNIEDLITYVSLILVNETGLNHNHFRAEVIRRVCLDCNCNLWRIMVFIGDFLANRKFLKSLSSEGTVSGLRVSKSETMNKIKKMITMANHKDSRDENIISSPDKSPTDPSKRSLILDVTKDESMPGLNDNFKLESPRKFKINFTEIVKNKKFVDEGLSHIYLSSLVKNSLPTYHSNFDDYGTYLDYLYSNPPSISTRIIKDHTVNSETKFGGNSAIELNQTVESQTIQSPNLRQRVDGSLISDLCKYSKSLDLLADADLMLSSVPERGEGFWEPVYEFEEDFCFPGAALGVNYIGLDSRVVPLNSTIRCEDLNIALTTYNYAKVYWEKIESELGERYFDGWDKVSQRRDTFSCARDYMYRIPCANIKGEMNGFKSKSLPNFSKEGLGNISNLKSNKMPCLDIPKTETEIIGFNRMITCLGGEIGLKRHMSLVGSSIRYMLSTKEASMYYLPYLSVISSFDLQMEEYLFNLSKGINVEDQKHLEWVYQGKMVGKGGRSTRNSKYQFIPHLDWLDSETVSHIVRKSHESIF